MGVLQHQIGRGLSGGAASPGKTPAHGDLVVPDVKDPGLEEIKRLLKDAEDKVVAGRVRRVVGIRRVRVFRDIEMVAVGEDPFRMPQRLDQRNDLDRILASGLDHLPGFTLFHAILGMGDFRMGIPLDVLAFPNQGIHLEASEQIAYRLGDLIPGAFAGQTVNAAKIERRVVDDFRAFKKDSFVVHGGQLNERSYAMKDAFPRVGGDAGQLIARQQAVALGMVRHGQASLFAQSGRQRVSGGFSQQDRILSSLGGFLLEDPRVNLVEILEILE